MRDARTPSGIWLKDAEVHVQGDPRAIADRATWTRVAVLKVSPSDMPFRIGWRTEQSGAAELYSGRAQTLNSMFAMEVGDQDVWFVARPFDGRTQFTIELVEITTLNDPKYVNLPRY